MTINDFKLWFQGFSDSVGTNGLTAVQFATVKKMVDKLGMPVSNTPEEPPQVEATAPITDHYLDILRKKREQDTFEPSPLKDWTPLTERFPPFNPHPYGGGIGNPSDPFSTGKYFLSGGIEPTQGQNEMKFALLENFDDVVDYFTFFNKKKPIQQH